MGLCRIDWAGILAVPLAVAAVILIGYEPGKTRVQPQLVISWELEDMPPTKMKERTTGQGNLNNALSEGYKKTSLERHHGDKKRINKDTQNQHKTGKMKADVYAEPYPNG